MKLPVLSLLAATLIACPLAPALAHQDTQGMMGDHDMTGTVKNLDHKKGTFTFQTAGGPSMQLHFPAEQLKDVKNGDTITVHLGFTKAAAAGK